MSKDEGRPDPRLKNIDPATDASRKKDSEKLIEVKKKDTSEDKNNEFVVHEKPFDEQMTEKDPGQDMKKQT